MNANVKLLHQYISDLERHGAELEAALKLSVAALMECIERLRHTEMVRDRLLNEATRNHGLIEAGRARIAEQQMAPPRSHSVY